MKPTPPKFDLYFSDAFKLEPRVIDRHGAFNISLVADLPLFVDPFLIFNSRRPVYRKLHKEIVRYLQFLYDQAQSQKLDAGLIAAWYRFPEIEQNWLGFSATGNHGRGLGSKFAGALHENLGLLFAGLNGAHITKDVHLEKLCLVSDRVGKDNISDFTNNLIHGFLLEYTQAFAQKHIDKSLRRTVGVQKVRFNYRTETWESRRFDLPVHHGKHVLLTPKDLLTKDDTWINKTDLYGDFDQIPAGIPNLQLRHQINNYFSSLLPRRRKKPTRKAERDAAILQTVRKFPELVDYYIRFKEDHGDRAVSVSDARVKESEQFYVRQVREFVAFLAAKTDFYKDGADSHDAALRRAKFLKDAIENKGCHRIFYVNGDPEAAQARWPGGRRADRRKGRQQAERLKGVVAATARAKSPLLLIVLSQAICKSCFSPWTSMWSRSPELSLSVRGFSIDCSRQGASRETTHSALGWYIDPPCRYQPTQSMLDAAIFNLIVGHADAHSKKFSLLDQAGSHGPTEFESYPLESDPHARRDLA